MNMTLFDVKFGDLELAANQWQELDQLWLYCDIRENEFSLQYCYSHNGVGGKRQFGDLIETRYPMVPACSGAQLLSPRSIVARPLQPLHLPANSATTLYVGTCLWFSLMAGDEPLLDLPVARLSDTWFGPDTRNGEICYAAQTHARLSLENYSPNPFKAMTRVEIINEAKQPLLVDRINLPINHASLFMSKTDDQVTQRCWTSDIVLKNLSRGSGAEVKIVPGNPRDCAMATLVAGPREPLNTGMLNKTMTFLFG